MLRFLPRFWKVFWSLFNSFWSIKSSKSHLKLENIQNWQIIKKHGVLLCFLKVDVCKNRRTIKTKLKGDTFNTNICNTSFLKPFFLTSQTFFVSLRLSGGIFGRFGVPRGYQKYAFFIPPDSLMQILGAGWCLWGYFCMIFVKNVNLLKKPRFLLGFLKIPRIFNVFWGPLKSQIHVGDYEQKHC